VARRQEAQARALAEELARLKVEEVGAAGNADGTTGGAAPPPPAGETDRPNDPAAPYLPLPQGHTNN
jgi:hypothetical protein